jgi:uncharacterized protein YabN with tetrapyrrole methylase and pyrophosphatase domain
MEIPPGLYVVGVGVKAVAHITLETHRIIQAMDLVVYCEAGETVARYLQDLKIPFHNALDLYKEGDERREVYERLAAIIIENKRSRSRVAYLTPGNPHFLNTVVSVLERECKREQVPFYLFSGLSSVDSIVTDLRIPVGDLGLQCYDATIFGRSRPAIDVSVPLLLFDPGVFNTSTICFRQAPPQVTTMNLRDCLLERYKPTTRWILVASSPEFGVPSQVYWGELGQLPRVSDIMHQGTLVIPGAWWPSWLCNADTRPPAIVR